LTSEWGGVFAWTRNVGSGQVDLEAASGLAVVSGGSLTALNPTDGSTAWTAPIPRASFPAPAAGDVVAAVSATDGRLYVLEAHDGHVVKTVPGGTSQTGVALRRDSLVTASDQGRVTGYRITRR
jgi:outer membrane protein assembly factor BamB